MLPFELTKDTPYLALSGELWSVFFEYFNRNWSCCKGFLLYSPCNWVRRGSVIAPGPYGDVTMKDMVKKIIDARALQSMDSGIILCVG